MPQVEIVRKGTGTRSAELIKLLLKSPKLEGVFREDRDPLRLAFSDGTVAEALATVVGALDEIDAGWTLHLDVVAAGE